MKQQVRLLNQSFFSFKALPPSQQRDANIGAFHQVLFALVFCFLFSPAAQSQNTKSWLTGGGDLFNTRNASGETKISASNASKLAVKWAFTTAGDVSATPVVDDQAIYFPDWAGNLYKVDAKTGALIWQKAFKDYTGQDKAFARASAAIAGSTLIIGTQMGTPPIGAFVLGINKNTGQLLWKTKVEEHFAAIITQSAVVNGNKAYVGVASQEEGIAADPTYPCCSFRGSMLCLDVKTGKILWKTYMTPAQKGFAGVAVWGSTPVIDAKRNSVYVATGNNYKVPQALIDCNAAGNTPQQVQACALTVDGSSQNYFDAVVSLDLNTGAIKWARSVIPFDAWTVACFFGGPNCPDNAGPDYDFGQGPALFTAGTGMNKRELLGAGQKSGIYWALNPDNGQEVWHTQVGPGGTLGGLEWGSAVDGNQIYTAIANNSYIPQLMTKGPIAGQTISGGFWCALNAATGAINWQNAGTNPPVTQPGFPAPEGAVAINLGMVTVANGVMFAGATDAVGTMYAFNAATGAKLWSFEAGGSVNAGPAVVDGTVYWGSGYSNFGLGTPNNKLYAFQVQDVNAAVTSIKANNETLELPTNTNVSISVYPSPAHDFMKITAKDRSNINTVRLYDLSGRLIKEVKVSGSPVYNLDVSTVQKGNYMINVITSTLNQSLKVAVVH